MTDKQKNTIEILHELWRFQKSERYSEKQIRDALVFAIEAVKAKPKKCPICGSDLYEYCFMCCYEGEKVKQNDEAINDKEVHA